MKGHRNNHGRTKTGAREGLDPSTSREIEYTEDEVEFMMAMERYRRESHRPFPTCSEVLEVARSLGYRRVEPPDDV